jgi:dTDP-glucose pyrophosphorylase/mannose-6-phosphate isomerase-like protein (cupin superfamily)
MLQVVIPMAGLGTRFTQYGFKQNKYLLPINIDLVPMIEVAITSLNINIPCKYFFIINEQHGEDTNLRNILHLICTKYSYNYVISSVNVLTEGPASTVYTISDKLDSSLPLLVSNSDQVLEWDFNKFYKNCLLDNNDGCVLTYSPPYNLILGSLDKHSFVRLNSENKIDKCAEKIVLSTKALVGVHYYKSAKMFFDGYDYIVKNNIRAPNGEYYLSLTYDAMIKLNYNVGYSDLEIGEKFHPVGEPDDYFNYLYSCGKYTHNIYNNIYNNNYNNNNKIIFKNDDIIITKHDLSIFSVHTFVNPGLIILLSGSATTTFTNLITKTNKTLIPMKQITSDNIIVLSRCSIISISFISCITEKLTHPVTNLKQIWDIDQFIRGWFIGDFTPSIVRTNLFEIAMLTHKKDERWDYHYHMVADETNVLIKGSMKINNKIIKTGDIFVIGKNQVTCPQFDEDCNVLCIKVPSVIGDKYCL